LTTHACIEDGVIGRPCASAVRVAPPIADVLPDDGGGTAKERGTFGPRTSGREARPWQERFFKVRLAMRATVVLKFNRPLQIDRS
jgi:hypothetical protein